MSFDSSLDPRTAALLATARSEYQNEPGSSRSFQLPARATLPSTSKSSMQSFTGSPSRPRNAPSGLPMSLRSQASYAPSQHAPPPRAPPAFDSPSRALPGPASLAALVRLPVSFSPAHAASGATFSTPRGPSAFAPGSAPGSARRSGHSHGHGFGYNSSHGSARSGRLSGLGAGASAGHPHIRHSLGPRHPYAVPFPLGAASPSLASSTPSLPAPAPLPPVVTVNGLAVALPPLPPPAQLPPPRSAAGAALAEAYADALAVALTAALGIDARVHAPAALLPLAAPVAAGARSVASAGEAMTLAAVADAVLYSPAAREELCTGDWELLLANNADAAPEDAGVADDSDVNHGFGVAFDAVAADADALAPADVDDAEAESDAEGLVYAHGVDGDAHEYVDEYPETHGGPKYVSLTDVGDRGNAYANPGVVYPRNVTDFDNYDDHMAYNNNVVTADGCGDNNNDDDGDGDALWLRYAASAAQTQQLHAQALAHAQTMAHAQAQADAYAAAQAQAHAQLQYERAGRGRGQWAMPSHDSFIAAGLQSFRGQHVPSRAPSRTSQPAAAHTTSPAHAHALALQQQQQQQAQEREYRAFRSAQRHAEQAQAQALQAHAVAALVRSPSRQAQLAFPGGAQQQQQQQHPGQGVRYGAPISMHLPAYLLDDSVINGDDGEDGGTADGDADLSEGDEAFYDTTFLSAAANAAARLRQQRPQYGPVPPLFSANQAHVLASTASAPSSARGPSLGASSASASFTLPARASPIGAVQQISSASGSMSARGARHTVTHAARASPAPASAFTAANNSKSSQSFTSGVTARRWQNPALAPAPAASAVAAAAARRRSGEVSPDSDMHSPVVQALNLDAAAATGRVLEMDDSCDNGQCDAEDALAADSESECERLLCAGECNRAYDGDDGETADCGRVDEHDGDDGSGADWDFHDPSDDDALPSDSYGRLASARAQVEPRPRHMSKRKGAPRGLAAESDSEEDLDGVDSSEHSDDGDKGAPDASATVGANAGKRERVGTSATFASLLLRLNGLTNGGNSNRTLGDAKAGKRASVHDDGENDDEDDEAAQVATDADVSAGSEQHYTSDPILSTIAAINGTRSSGGADGLSLDARVTGDWADFGLGEVDSDYDEEYGADSVVDRRRDRIGSDRVGSDSVVASDIYGPEVSEVDAVDSEAAEDAALFAVGADEGDTVDHCEGDDSVHCAADGLEGDFEGDEGDGGHCEQELPSCTYLALPEDLERVPAALSAAADAVAHFDSPVPVLISLPAALASEADSAPAASPASASTMATLALTPGAAALALARTDYARKPTVVLLLPPRAPAPPPAAAAAAAAGAAAAGASLLHSPADAAVRCGHRALAAAAAALATAAAEASAESGDVRFIGIAVVAAEAPPLCFLWPDGAVSATAGAWLGAAVADMARAAATVGSALAAQRARVLKEEQQRRAAEAAEAEDADDAAVYARLCADARAEAEACGAEPVTEPEEEEPENDDAAHASFNASFSVAALGDAAPSGSRPRQGSAKRGAVEADEVGLAASMAEEVGLYASGSFDAAAATAVEHEERAGDADDKNDSDSDADGAKGSGSDAAPVRASLAFMLARPTAPSAVSKSNSKSSVTAAFAADDEDEECLLAAEHTAQDPAAAAAGSDAAASAEAEAAVEAAVRAAASRFAQHDPVAPPSDSDSDDAATAGADSGDSDKPTRAQDALRRAREMLSAYADDDDHKDGDGVVAVADAAPEAQHKVEHAAIDDDTVAERVPSPHSSAVSDVEVEEHAATETVTVAEHVSTAADAVVDAGAYAHSETNDASRTEPAVSSHAPHIDVVVLDGDAEDDDEDGDELTSADLIAFLTTNRDPMGTDELAELFEQYTDMRAAELAAAADGAPTEAAAEAAAGETLDWAAFVAARQSVVESWMAPAVQDAGEAVQSGVAAEHSDDSECNVTAETVQSSTSMPDLPNPLMCLSQPATTADIDESAADDDAHHTPPRSHAGIASASLVLHVTPASPMKSPLRSCITSPDSARRRRRAVRRRHALHHPDDPAPYGPDSEDSEDVDTPTAVNDGAEGGGSTSRTAPFAESAEFDSSGDGALLSPGGRARVHVRALRRRSAAIAFAEKLEQVRVFDPAQPSPGAAADADDGLTEQEAAALRRLLAGTPGVPHRAIMTDGDDSDGDGDEDSASSTAAVSEDDWDRPVRAAPPAPAVPPIEEGDEDAAVDDWDRPVKASAPTPTVTYAAESDSGVTDDNWDKPVKIKSAALAASTGSTVTDDDWDKPVRVTPPAAASAAPEEPAVMEEDWDRPVRVNSVLPVAKKVDNSSSSSSSGDNSSSDSERSDEDVHAANAGHDDDHHDEDEDEEDFSHCCDGVPDKGAALARRLAADTKRATAALDSFLRQTHEEAAANTSFNAVHGRTLARMFASADGGMGGAWALEPSAGGRRGRSGREPRNDQIGVGPDDSTDEGERNEADADGDDIKDDSSFVSTVVSLVVTDAALAAAEIEAAASEHRANTEAAAATEDGKYPALLAAGDADDLSQSAVDAMLLADAFGGDSHNVSGVEHADGDVSQPDPDAESFTAQYLATLEALVSARDTAAAAARAARAAATTAFEASAEAEAALAAGGGLRLKRLAAMKAQAAAAAAKEADKLEAVAAEAAVAAHAAGVPIAVSPAAAAADEAPAATGESVAASSSESAAAAKGRVKLTPAAALAQIEQRKRAAVAWRRNRDPTAVVEAETKSEADSKPEAETKSDVVAADDDVVETVAQDQAKNDVETTVEAKVAAIPGSPEISDLDDGIDEAVAAFNAADAVAAPPATGEPAITAVSAFDDTGDDDVNRSFVSVAAANALAEAEKSRFYNDDDNAEAPAPAAASSAGAVAGDVDAYFSAIDDSALPMGGDDEYYDDDDGCIDVAASSSGEINEAEHAAEDEDSFNVVHAEPSHDDIPIIDAVSEPHPVAATEDIPAVTTAEQVTEITTPAAAAADAAKAAKDAAAAAVTADESDGLAPAWASLAALASRASAAAGADSAAAVAAESAAWASALASVDAMQAESAAAAARTAAMRARLHAALRPAAPALPAADAEAAAMERAQESALEDIEDVLQVEEAIAEAEAAAAALRARQAAEVADEAVGSHPDSAVARSRASAAGSTTPEAETKSESQDDARRESESEVAELEARKSAFAAAAAALDSGLTQILSAADASLVDLYPAATVETNTNAADVVDGDAEVYARAETVVGVKVADELIPNDGNGPTADSDATAAKSKKTKKKRSKDAARTAPDSGSDGEDEYDSDDDDVDDDGVPALSEPDVHNEVVISLPDPTNNESVPDHIAADPASASLPAPRFRVSFIPYEFPPVEDSAGSDTEGLMLWHGDDGALAELSDFEHDALTAELEAYRADAAAHRLTFKHEKVIFALEERLRGRHNINLNRYRFDPNTLPPTRPSRSGRRKSSRRRNYLPPINFSPEHPDGDSDFSELSPHSSDADDETMRRDIGQERLNYAFPAIRQPLCWFEHKNSPRSVKYHRLLLYTHRMWKRERAMAEKLRVQRVAQEQADRILRRAELEAAAAARTQADARALEAYHQDMWRVMREKALGEDVPFPGTPEYKAWFADWAWRNAKAEAEEPARRAAEEYRKANRARFARIRRQLVPVNVRPQPPPAALVELPLRAQVALYVSQIQTEAGLREALPAGELAPGGVAFLSPMRCAQPDSLIMDLPRGAMGSDNESEGDEYNWRFAINRPVMHVRVLLRQNSADAVADVLMKLHGWRIKDIFEIYMINGDGMDLVEEFTYLLRKSVPTN